MVKPYMGGGFLLSSQAEKKWAEAKQLAEERKETERLQREEQRATYRIVLSDREREIIKALG